MFQANYFQDVFNHLITLNFFYFFILFTARQNQDVSPLIWYGTLWIYTHVDTLHSLWNERILRYNYISVTGEGGDLIILSLWIKTKILNKQKKTSEYSKYITVDLLIFACLDFREFCDFGTQSPEFENCQFQS